MGVQRCTHRTVRRQVIGMIVVVIRREDLCRLHLAQQQEQALCSSMLMRRQTSIGKAQERNAFTVNAKHSARSGGLTDTPTGQFRRWERAVRAASIGREDDVHVRTGSSFADDRAAATERFIIGMGRDNQRGLTELLVRERLR